MGSEIPKQFLTINGVPLLVYTLKQFAEDESLKLRIVLVLPEIQSSYWLSLVEKYGVDSSGYEIVFGGPSRGQSIRNGLNHLADLADDALIAVHDGVRPFAGQILTGLCFAEAEKFGNAVPVVAIRDSMRAVKSNGSESVNRENFVAVQTPQVFRHSQLKAAYSPEFFDEASDDATLVERAGFKIHTVPGHHYNFKVTFPPDFAMAEWVVKNKLGEL